MRVTVTARGPLIPTVREYAERRLGRLARHADLHDIRLIVGREEHRVPACTAEVIVHMDHHVLTVSAAGRTAQEAIDLAVDKADRRVIRAKDVAAPRRRDQR